MSMITQCVYPNLAAEMAGMKKNTLDLAALLGVSRKTAENRLAGRNTFELDEIIKIRNEWFPHATLDYLCSYERSIENACR